MELPRCWRFQSQESSSRESRTQKVEATREVCMLLEQRWSGGALILDGVLQDLVFVLRVFGVALVQSSFTMSKEQQVAIKVQGVGLSGGNPQDNSHMESPPRSQTPECLLFLLCPLHVLCCYPFLISGHGLVWADSPLPGK